MLLTSANFSEQLFTAINRAESSLLIASAFIKLDALKALADIRSDLNVTVVARWQKRDLVTGASDPEVYQFCQSKGWQFGISQNFHGKVYMVDRQDVFLGSANFTQRGLNLGRTANIEFGTVIPADQTNLQRIDQFLKTEIIWLDDDIFNSLEKDIESTKDNHLPPSDQTWSEHVKNLLITEVDYLWVQQLLFTTPDELLHLNLNNEHHAHDFGLLNLSLDELSYDSLCMAFKQSHLYIWVISQLKRNNSMQFGAFSAALHNALLDDPAPYRREVKQFIQTLFAWFELVKDTFIVTRHNRTSSVKLIEHK